MTRPRLRPPSGAVASPTARVVVALLVVTLVAVVVAVALAVAQGQARERAEREAAVAAQHALRTERAELDRARRAEEARVALVTLTREAAAADAAAVLAQATALLARTEGQVDDDAVRVAVADGAAALGALLADRPAETSGDAAAGPSAGPSSVAARITAAAADLRAATAALSDAHGTWLAEEEARAAEAAAAARAEEEARAAAAAAAAGAEGDGSAGRPAPSRAAGAGPDCGGPDSYEPPTGTATFYTSTPSETGDGSNGRLPRSAMSALGWCVDARGNAQWLRADAAAALTRLNKAFRAAFGENVAVDMSYRSYEDQVAMREHYGGVAARPGTSNHGWGTAFDTWEWSAYAFGSARYEWLVTNAPAYGWVAPSWARQGGTNPEYWHFEYVG